MSQPDTKLTLGDFTFIGTEVPGSIPMGGGQVLAVHDFIGGERTVDAMGSQDAPIEWSGIMLGMGALDRVRYLDRLRKEGAQVVLTWSEMAYLVVVDRFTSEQIEPFRFSYRMSCVVVKDYTTPVRQIAPGFDQAIADDSKQAKALGNEIGDGPLSTALASLDGAIKAVSTFASATTAQINSVLAPIAAVQGRVSDLLAAVGNTTQSVTTLGGILPNNPVAKSAAGLLQQATAFQQHPMLVNLQSVIGRMNGNVGRAAGGSRVVTSASPNLFQVAANEYGDATLWTAIAKANGLTDPKVSGIASLAIPAKPASTGGVLNA